MIAVHSTQLHLLLAPKERFEAAGAGAFALIVLETSRASRFRSDIKVFGSPVAEPFSGIRFQRVNKARWWEGDRNRTMARHYARLAAENPPRLIEIYNRPAMIGVLRQKFPDVPVMLHLANDPRGMDGSRSTSERSRVLHSCAAIVCVSRFIRRCYLEGIDDPLAARVHVIPIGVPLAPELPSKTNRIVYVGRVIPDKGVLELVQALARVLPHHPDWSAEIIGARWFGSGEKPTDYEKTVAQEAAACDRIVLAGFRPHGEVIEALRGAGIAVVPSRWDDPFPRTALEALAQGCALICSTSGGLPELGQDRALFVESISAQSLAEALDRLIRNADERRALQHRGREGSPFDIRRTTSLLDDLREKVMARS